MDYEKVCSLLSVIGQMNVKVKEQVEVTIEPMLEQLKWGLSIALPQVKESLEDFDYKASLDLAISSCAVYIIAILTFPHVYSRYPDSKVLKPSEYHLELGIVRASLQVRNYLENAIKSLKNGLA